MHAFKQSHAALTAPIQSDREYTKRKEWTYVGQYFFVRTRVCLLARHTRRGRRPPNDLYLLPSTTPDGPMHPRGLPARPPTGSAGRRDTTPARQTGWMDGWMEEALASIK
jgi:hypothetical protein